MKKKLIILLLLTLSNISFAQQNESCHKKENIGTIGKEGQCLNKLIVDNKLLREIVDKREDYSHTKIYTFHVTDMSSLFENDIERYSEFDMVIIKEKSDIKNKPVLYDITGWDVSNVTNMSKMFLGATKFNQNIEKWNVSNVTDMSYMFSYNESFNQPLNEWDVSSVKNMQDMFSYTERFDQPLEKWNVSNVQNMKYMFSFANNFNQPLEKWNLSNVKYRSYMFLGANNFNQPLDN